MKNIAQVISLLGVAVSLVVAADRHVPAVEGMIVRLNEPGTILVEISVGIDDGLKTGDIFVVSRNEKLIGKLVIATCEPDRATANIIGVQNGETLRTGDRIKSELDCDEAS